MRVFSERLRVSARGRYLKCLIFKEKNFKQGFATADAGARQIAAVLPFHREI